MIDVIPSAGQKNLFKCSYTFQTLAQVGELFPQSL